MIKSRKLRHKITIEQVTETQDSFGGIVETWATFAIRSASVEPLQGREFYDSQIVNAEINIRFRIRYLAGLDTKMRVVHGTRTFNIESIIHIDERQKEMHLMCVEVV